MVDMDSAALALRGAANALEARSKGERWPGNLERLGSTVAPVCVRFADCRDVSDARHGIYITKSCRHGWLPQAKVRIHGPEALALTLFRHCSDDKTRRKSPEFPQL